MASVLAAVLVSSQTGRVSAQEQSSATMLVTAVVARKCVLTTTTLNFGNYDPLQTHATTPLDGQSTITVACTKGTLIAVGIDVGTHNSGTSRRMRGDFRDYLNYELYKDQNRTQRWGTSESERLDGGVAPSRDPRSFPVYGRVPAGQDVDRGTFADTVVVTVDF